MATHGKDKLIEQVKQAKISAAYLVVCDQQEELAAFAEEFLLTLFCQRKTSCGVCHACKMILSGNAPDIMSIHPEKDVIKVDMIRKVNSFLAKKSYEGYYKVVVIYGADQMNLAAQNALLKPLEQPPANTAFLLLASSDFSMLPTVISRCYNLRLMPQDRERALQNLVDEGITPKLAKLALNLSAGFLNQARQIACDQAYLDLREQTIINVFKLLDQPNYAITYFVDFIEKNKQALGDMFNIIKMVLMDILKLKLSGEADIVINIDKLSEIQDKTNHFTTAQICNMIDKLLVFELRTNFNVNFRLNLESMLFEILEEKYRWLEL
jgi:DNA polymerase III subunit delta'